MAVSTGAQRLTVPEAGRVSLLAPVDWHTQGWQKRALCWPLRVRKQARLDRRCARHLVVEIASGRLIFLNTLRMRHFKQQLAERTCLQTFGVRVRPRLEQPREAEVDAAANRNNPHRGPTMETFLVAKEGRQTAFQIDNVYVSRRAVARLLMKAEGVTDVQLRGRFGSSDETRVEFKYLGRDYIVWEPFGDNSRYWIGPKNPEEDAADIVGLESIFKRYRPPLHRALLGTC
jgi:hypothetical protein